MLSMRLEDFALKPLTWLNQLEGVGDNPQALTPTRFKPSKGSNKALTYGGMDWSCANIPQNTPIQCLLKLIECFEVLYFDVHLSKLTLVSPKVKV